MLARFSLESKQYFIAERCYAALGDVAKARFLRETNRIASESEKEVLHFKVIIKIK